jgi:hypothetical protein
MGLNGMRWLLKRWWFWAGAAFMLVAVGAGYLLIPVEKPRITQENCDKIELGWTLPQIVELLGPHPYIPLERLEVERLVSLCPLKLEEGDLMGVFWDDDDGNIIAVTFAHDGVISKRFEPTKSTLFHLVKGRIERRIRALWP